MFISGLKKHFSSALKGITSIMSNELPPPIGPYSQGIRVNLAKADLIFCSGSLGVDQKGNIVSNDIEKQTIQALNNIQSLLENNNSSLTLVTKTTVFLTDMKDFQKMNEVYAKYFKDNYPARSTIEVKGLPKPEAKVEIECIALTSDKKI